MKERLVANLPMKMNLRAGPREGTPAGGQEAPARSWILLTHHFPTWFLQRDLFSQAAGGSGTVTVGQRGAGAGGATGTVGKGHPPSLGRPCPRSSSGAPMHVDLMTKWERTPQTHLRRARRWLCAARTPLGAPSLSHRGREALSLPGLSSGWPRGFACLAQASRARRGGGTHPACPGEPAALPLRHGKTNSGWKMTVATPRRGGNRLNAWPRAPDAAGRPQLHRC